MTKWIRHIGNRGVTLIELFVAIAIAAILVGAGLPAFLTLIQGSRIDGATRQVMYEIRAVQSLAVTRGGTFEFHWGADPMVGMAPGVYRIERNQTGNCADWPLPADTTATNTDVIRDWFDLAGEYAGVTIQSVEDNNNTALGGVMFNSRGASLNNCAVPPAPVFPVWVCVADGEGRSRAIQIQRAGRVSIIQPIPAGVCP